MLDHPFPLVLQGLSGDHRGQNLLPRARLETATNGLTVLREAQRFEGSLEENSDLAIHSSPSNVRIKA